MKTALKRIENKIIGMHPDITGDVNGIRGNIDDCEITKKEREKGIHINDLIKR